MKLEIFKHNGDGYVVSSRVIARGLRKRHSDVIETIEKMFESQQNLENGNFRSLIFKNYYRVNNQNRTYKEYLLTKDGFILYMFNIQGHIDFKMAYINEFNRMEKQLKEKNTLPFNKEEKEGVKLMRQIYEAKEKVQVSLSNYKFLLLSNKVMIEDELMYIKNSEFKTNKMEIYFNGKSHCLAKSLIEFE